MRYILIDPDVGRISEKICIGKMDLEFLCRELECEVAERTSLAPDVDMWVDEEYLLKARRDSRYFTFGKYEYPIGGRALVCGLSPGGNSISLSPRYSIDDVVRNVKFEGDLDDIIVGMHAGRIKRPTKYLHCGATIRKIWEWRPEAVPA